MVRECPAAYRRVRATEAKHSSVHAAPTRQPGRARTAPRPRLRPAPGRARPTATPRGRPGRARHVRAGSTRHVSQPADDLHGGGAAQASPRRAKEELKRITLSMEHEVNQPCNRTWPNSPEPNNERRVL